jgi:serine acetyltransferase
MLMNRAYRAVFSYRLCRWLKTSRNPVWRLLAMPTFVVHRLFTGLICSEVPIRTEIGSGFLLVHGYGVVINVGAVIGRNVTILHQVTIGASAKGLPLIGDGAVLAANSIVIGPVSIGDQATIGAASVVLRDVPNNTIVGGNPARVIASNASGRAKNVWLG